jgi:hemolysin activation/secretion protein
MTKLCRLSCASFVTAVFAAYSFTAVAQVAPSQVTPDTLRPAPTNSQQGVLLSGGAGLQAPPGADQLKVTLRRLAITGSFSELDEANRAFALAIEGKRVSVARIYELATAFEQTYARAGYVLVRVTVPPQKLEDGGVLRIVVVDGFVEKVEVKNVPDRVRTLVASRMASLVGQRHIKLEAIERRLLTAGDVPGLHLKSILERGTTLGGTLLVLEGTHQLVTGTATIDNHLSASLGTWSYGTNVAVNSLFGLGEQFYVSENSGGDPNLLFGSLSPLQLFGAGAVLPVGLDGWIVNPEYTYSRTDPKVASGGLTDIGNFWRLALRTSYPLIRTRTQTLMLTGAFEFINQNTFLPLFVSDLNSDRYGVLRAGAAYDTGLPWWNETIQVSATYSHGTGGRDAADAIASGVPLSRQGAGPLFDKANVDVHLIQPLPEAFRFDLIGRLQTSFGAPLLVPEQFFLDGPQAVSAYPSGSLPVDEGGTLRGELIRSFTVTNFAVPLILSPYAFGVVGVGRLNDPTIVEVALVRAASVGGGLRSSVDAAGGYQGVSIGIEAARQYSNLPNLAQSWRGNVNLIIRF